MAFSQLQALSAATLDQNQEVSDEPDITSWSDSRSSGLPYELIYSSPILGINTSQSAESSTWAASPQITGHSF